MLNRLILLASLVAAAIVMVMLFFTTPAGIGPFGVFIFFSMIYVVVFGVMVLMVRIFIRLVQRRKTMRNKDYAYAGLLAFWPLMILLLISIGTNNWIISVAGATFFVGIGLVLVKKVW